MATIYHLLMAALSIIMTMSQSKAMYMTLDFMNLIVLSPVSRSESNVIPLGCGRTEDWQHECTADKSVEMM